MHDAYYGLSHSCKSPGTVANCVTSIYGVAEAYIYMFVGRVAQSVWRLTTGWTVRDRIPVGTRFSIRLDRP